MAATTKTSGMQFFLNNMELFSCNWHPGCYRASRVNPDGTPIFDRVSVRKVGPNACKILCEDYEEGVMIKPKVPKSLAFSIYFDNSVSNLDRHELWNGLLIDFSVLNDKEIQLIKHEPLKVIETAVKDEYLEPDRKNRELDDKKMKRIDTLIEILEEDLGCIVREQERQSYETPKEWLRVTNEYYNYVMSSIEVRCDEKSKFYKIMAENGIFEKYYPEWYAKGAF